VHDKTVHALLRSRQILDFRPLELEDPTNRVVLSKLRELSEAIYRALRDGREPAANRGAAIGTPLSAGLATNVDPASSEPSARAPAVPAVAPDVRALRDSRSLSGPPPEGQIGSAHTPTSTSVPDAAKSSAPGGRFEAAGIIAHHCFP
jgi:hypothetical protein